MTTIERVIPIEYVELVSEVKAKQEEVRNSRLLATAPKTYPIISVLKGLVNTSITGDVDEIVFTINKLSKEIGEGVYIIGDKELMYHLAEVGNLQEAVRLLSMLNEDNLVGYYTKKDDIAQSLDYVTLLSTMLNVLTRGYEEAVRTVGLVVGTSEDESGRTHY